MGLVLGVIVLLEDPQVVGVAMLLHGWEEVVLKWIRT
jgi:hypothetical protein